jgi:hypothetical protein
MTVPVFNAMLGIPAGYYVAKRSILLELNNNDAEEKINEAARFTTYIIIVLALISGVIALIDPYTLGSLRAMFRVDENLFGRIFFYIIFYDGFVNLDSEPLGRILIHIIIFGGLKLIAAQYLITKFTGKFIYKYFIKAEQKV